MDSEGIQLLPGVDITVFILPSLDYVPPKAHQWIQTKLVPFTLETLKLKNGNCCISSLRSKTLVI